MSVAKESIATAKGSQRRRITQSSEENPATRIKRMPKPFLPSSRQM
jgi:hypothetical protein